ncbi:hypothetical protein DUI87_13509 [Hirundo rustica rustica]|uniref:ribonuclease H n=1 Tax=Hirundo rustica rustica TaxID=333673 RepID=A0A3M0K9E0_HIRRU|nr:hypothetical protein DUI87_13509 [Hirundo rustica rustica]
MPNAPSALLGRDLLEQLEARIIFKNGEISLEVKDQQYVELLSLMLTTKEIEVASEKENFRKIMDQVFPGVWASNIPGRAKNALPVQIRLKEGGQPVRVKQYPLKKEDIEGVSPIIENLLQLGLLRECQSDFNTPILPVKKPDGSYRLVQDLRAVNKVTEDLYPVVANPYTLLTHLTPELTWFTVLDLKDAFFCLPLHEASQKIFAFDWESPKTGRKTQLAWCVLPQGYKNSPTIFGEQLAKDLESWEPPPGEGQLLQYVDDLLIATQTQETCVDWTVSLLNFLGLQGYRVSQKKAQMVRQTVIYLGYEDFQTGCTGEPVIHDCLETIEATYWSCPDLNDTPLEDAETWFTDGSSYVVSGRRHAGYAVTTSREVIESGPLPTNTSAQKAEIITLIRALELAKGKEINIYTDSRYAFGVVHAHGAIWKERGLLNSQGKSIKHAQEILRLLDAIQLPERVAVMHIKAHQKVSSELEEGNMLADREAKEAAKGEVPDKAVEAALIPDGKVSIEGKPVYNKKDKKLIKVCTKYHKNQTKITPPVPRKAVITKMSAIPEVEEQITPVVTKIGPYAIKKTGVQKLIVNPKWSLKRVEMGVQGTLDRARGSQSPDEDSPDFIL